MPFEHRAAWIEINLQVIQENYERIKSKLNGDAKVCAVVKADAYGHGILPVAKKLSELGVNYFAVATLNEAMALREALKDVDILILGYTPNDEAKTLIEYNLIQTLYAYEQGIAYDACGKAMGKPLRVHVKFDTGLRRLGFAPTDQSIEEIEKLSKCAFLSFEGIYSHFAKSDELDHAFSHKQAELFLSLVEKLAKRGVVFPMKHMCNSAGFLQFPEYHFDMVRPGIIFYGLAPSEEMTPLMAGYKEAMCIKAEVAHAKCVVKGDGVSYGHLYHLPEDMQVITLPLGYADGLLRGFSGKAHVLVKGKPYPIVGSVCMDQCLVNVGDLIVERGEEVVVMGGNHHPQTAIAAYAKALNTIPYEITCQFSIRLKHKYLG